VLTPPDVISQTLLAVPVWMLFELGLFFSGWFLSKKGNRPDSGDDADGYKPLTDTEMEAELDRMDADQDRD
jgi:sec-independent protein translocase protein TatC